MSEEADEAIPTGAVTEDPVQEKASETEDPTNGEGEDKEEDKAVVEPAEEAEESDKDDQIKTEEPSSEDPTSTDDPQQPELVTMSGDPSLVMMKALEVVLETTSNNDNTDNNDISNGDKDKKEEPKDKHPKTRVIQVPKPMAGASELLVKVKYSAIDTAMTSIGSNNMAASYLHDMKTKPIRAGYHFSGTVEALGPNASTENFKEGDAVFGHLPYQSSTHDGAFSEYITVPAASCAIKPDDIAFDVAAAATSESMVALQALRDMGRLSVGKSVLILGAGGSVGSAAIGIAKSIGASVTAVCSGRDVERVNQLGADFVVDRSQADITKKGAFGSKKFDVVFDVPSKYGLWDAMGWLKRNGVFVNTLQYEKMDIAGLGWFVALLTGKKFKTVWCESKQADLEVVAMWIEEGTLRFDIESTYKISDFDQAWQKFDEPNKTGRVVIQVEDGW
mmetsp:Transcript_18100/g.49359  ORF Transcript_18100/g.49359 Transcript_18100/m.49359 type:complete len:448 (-) Transcript_18100:201-1544(-)|eukprot:CAMPEP_0168748114 /NCGR_PEP_ID=MMETSP0724-20121128/16008_1 /TAXON_ID=265536 /ORGANISM="Amphiprora sp., Strain CCMP467" /LENGTH=447 /DNA_ID=CAMNT_0008795931 /DNA_START=45 /DNA_END=1388 /DNA_ORIENTATION=+